MYIHEHNCTQSMKEIVRFVSIFVNMKVPGSVFAPPKKRKRKFRHTPKCFAIAAHFNSCYKYQDYKIELSFVIN